MLWNAVQNALAATLPAGEYNLWIKPLVCAREDKEGLVLAGPDRYFCAFVEQRYLDLIRRKSREAGGGPSVRFLTDAGLDGTGQTAIRAAGNGRQLRLPGLPREAIRLPALHPAFTFDQFMVGESNILAQSACRALAQGDDSFGRCLFMDSATGLGKSHLTQAVVHQVLRSAPSTRLRYLSAQQFTAEMVRCLRDKSMDQFAERYVDDCDMLLLEDVQTLSGRTKSQEELNIVLDYLLKSGRRVILTSTLPPDRIDGLDPEVRSRMASGLLASIQAPSFETRVRIIRHKMAAQDLRADDDVVEYLASRLKNDVRRMESAILSLKARSCLTRTPPDVAMVREALNGFGGDETVAAALPSLSAEAICATVSARFRVSQEDLRSRSRKRCIVLPRQMAMYLTRKFTRHSLAEIGALFDRDHSTVLHAIKTITRQMTLDASLREQLDLISGEFEKQS